MRLCTLRGASAAAGSEATSLGAATLEHASRCRTASVALPIDVELEDVSGTLERQPEPERPAGPASPLDPVQDDSSMTSAATALAEPETSADEALDGAASNADEADVDTGEPQYFARFTND